MVPLSERDKLLQLALADPGLCEYTKFIYKQPLTDNCQDKSRQMKVLESINNGKAKDFESMFADYSARQVNPDSDWIHNDCLVFLLLLGCQKFGLSRLNLEPVLTSRERNSNPVAIKTNQVFRAIQRREFAMEGDYCFLKVVFLELIDQFSISKSSANAAYQSLTKLGLLDELSQFLQIVAIRAFDLLILTNAPSDLKTVDEVVEVIHQQAPNWSFAKTIKLFFALPNKVMIPILAGTMAGAIFLGGAGYKAMEVWLSHQANTATQNGEESVKPQIPLRDNSGVTD